MAEETKNLSDEDLDAMGVDPTPEAREQARAMSSMMVDMMKVMDQHRDKMGGRQVTDYRSIRLDPDLGDEDFAFEVPEGTPKRSSLLEGMFQLPPAAPPE